jgi:aminoglycoside 3-N-acetyltransferase
MNVDGERSAIESGRRPLSAASLANDVRALGIGTGELIMVHSSLSALGWVAGGPQAVVEALLQVVGETGTVVMPSQSGQLSDPKEWENPPLPDHWIDDARAALPAYDRSLTPTRGMGAVVECFRRHPEAVRSDHPLLSLVAVGADAAAVTADHTVLDGLTMSSPLGRLYDRNATLLLLGVDHGSTTALHLAEELATWPGKQRGHAGAPILVNGVREWVTYDELAYDDEDFARIGDAFAATGGEGQGPVGEGEARCCSIVELVDFGTDWMARNRGASGSRLSE